MCVFVRFLKLIGYNLLRKQLRSGICWSLKLFIKLENSSLDSFRYGASGKQQHKAGPSLPHAGDRPAHHGAGGTASASGSCLPSFCCTAGLSWSSAVHVHLISTFLSLPIRVSLSSVAYYTLYFGLQSWFMCVWFLVFVYKRLYKFTLLWRNLAFQIFKSNGLGWCHFDKFV